MDIILDLIHTQPHSNQTLHPKLPDLMHKK